VTTGITVHASCYWNEAVHTEQKMIS